MMARSSVDRLKMACDMFTTAKILALAGIAQDAKNSAPFYDLKLLFIMMYGKYYSPERQTKILAAREKG